MTDISSDETEESREIDMRANAIDQSNVNHQSNMTLSAHSVITQSHYCVKITDIFAGEEVDENEKW